MAASRVCVTRTHTIIIIFFLTLGINDPEGFQKLCYARKLEWPLVLLLDKAVVK